jgi:hypothetical protein
LFLLASAAECREEESWIAMGGPIAPQDVQGARGKRYVPVDGSLAAVDVNQRARGVDVADLEGDALGEPQPEGVDRPEAGAARFAAGGRDDPADLLNGEDVGELHLRRQAQVLECLPVAWHGATEEELDAAVGNRQRPASEVALVLEVGEETPDLRFVERVGRLAVVLGELTDGSHVGFAGALGESGELEVLKETLAKNGHGRLLCE